MLFVAQIAEVVASALRAAEIDGRVAVLDEPRLARAVRDRGRDVVVIGAKLRGLKRTGGIRICGTGQALPLADESVGALVTVGLGELEAWEAQLSRFIDAVTDGGLIVCVDRAVPHEMSRRALCGGLAEIEQRQAGRTIVTSGRVRKLVGSNGQIGSPGRR